MKQRVTLLKSNLSAGGGLEKYTLYIAQVFYKLGCEVVLLTSGKELSHPFLEGVEVHYFKKKKNFSFQKLLAFDTACRNFLLAHPSDIVFGLDRNSFQTHYRAGNGCHAAFLKQRGRQSSFIKRLSFFINPLHRTLLNFEKATYENKDTQIFANSNMVKEEILTHYAAFEENIHVVHNGVEWEAFEPAFSIWPEIRQERLKEYGLDPDAYQFLFAGHGFHRKGLKPLLRALKRLDKYEVQLSVVGKDKDIKEFQSLVSALSLDKKVKFFGKIESVTPFYQMADALVLPTLYDPFANVTLEAAAMGLYILTSKNNGATEILDPSNSSIIEDPLSPLSIEKALVQALEHRKTFPSSENIRNSVQPYNFSTQLDKLASLILKDPSYATANNLS